MEGLTFSIIMFGVITILFTFVEAYFYLEDRKMSKKDKMENSKKERIKDYFNIRNKVDKIIQIKNL